MRRSFAALATAVAVLLAMASPSLAAKPEHVVNAPLDPNILAAGGACDFEVSLVNVDLKSRTSTWEEEDGTVRILDRGWATGYAEGPGGQTDLSGGYTIEIVIHPDGSIDFTGTGALFVWYFAGDAIVGLDAPGAYAINGRVTESYAADGSLTGARFYGGRVTNLCTALAPAS